MESNVMKIINVVFLIAISNMVYSADFESVDAIPEGVESVPAVIPIFSQKVSFKLPTNWKVAFENQQSDSYMIEFIPKSESINIWENLLTIQGFKNLADRMTPENFLDDLVVSYKGICDDAFIFEKLGLIDITGHQAFAAIIGCANLPDPQGNYSKEGQSELGYYISIKGENDFYLIHKSISGNAFNINESPINKDNTSEFMALFLPIELCKKSGEPYECNK
jgi:hypothetical protein